MIQRIAFMSGLVLMLGLCAGAFAQDDASQEKPVKPVTDSNPFEKLMISMTDKDILEKKLPQEIASAMHWVIKEAIRQSPTVEPSGKNLKRLENDFAALLISIVYPSSKTSLQAKQVITDLRRGLTNLSLRNLDLGLTEEEVKTFKSNGRRYLSQVASSLDEALDKVTYIQIPKELWRAYKLNLIDLSRTGIHTPTQAKDNSDIWKTLEPVPMTRNEYSMIQNFVYSRIITTLAIAVYDNERTLNNIFRIPNPTKDGKRVTITVPSYPDNMKQLLKTYLDAYIIARSIFVYEEWSLDGFPQWHQIKAATDDLIKRRKNHRESLLKSTDSGEYWKFQKK